MRSFRILATVALAGMLALLTSARPGSVGAAGMAGMSVHPFSDTASNAAYDIEAYNFYCTGGGIQCVAAGKGQSAAYCRDNGFSCPGLNYADAEAYGLPNGSTSGTPAAMYVECTHFTATGSQGAFVSVYSAAGTSTYQYIESDLGVIGGNAALLSWFQQNPNFPSDYGEGNVAQPSSIDASAYDPYAGSEGYGDRVSVTGIQNTNNTDDSYNGGRFTITVTGEIDTYDTSGAFQSYHMGTISCQAGGPQANDLGNAGLDEPYFEGELEWDYTGL